MGSLDLSVRSGSDAAQSLGEAGERRAGSIPPAEPLLALDDFLGAAGDTEFTPDGDAAEVTTSSTDSQDIATFTVPVDRAAILVETSAESDANGSIEVWVGGTEFGPFTGSVDYSIPWESAKLTGGDTVAVKGASDSGSSTTLRGSIAVLLV